MSEVPLMRPSPSVSGREGARNLRMEPKLQHENGEKEVRVGSVLTVAMRRRKLSERRAVDELGALGVGGRAVPGRVT